MNKKITKILSLAIAVAALLALAIGFSVSAETEEPALDIISKNMSYGSNFKLAFAVDNTGVADNQTVEVLLYAEDPALNPDTPVYKATLAKDFTYDGTYPVYFSYGIPAKDLTAYVWAQAHIVGTETYGKVYRYSAVEYFYERLYTETSSVTEAQAKLYNTVLQYCADAQGVLATDSPKINEVYYVYAPGTGAFGNDYSALVSADYELDLTYDGVIAAGNICNWNVKYVAADGTVTTDTLANGDKVPSGKHIIATADIEKFTVDFDDFDSSKAEVLNGILQNPAEGFYMTYNSKLHEEKNPIKDGVAYWATDVCEAPAPKYEGDLAYKVYTKYSQKSTGVVTDNDYYGATVIPLMAGEGNCYTFEYSAYIASSNVSTGSFYQLNFITDNNNTVVRMTLTGQSVNTVIGYRFFSSNANGADKYRSIGGYLNTNEWFTIRAEVYFVGGSEYYITKYFVNDHWIGDDVSYNSGSTNPINRVQVNSMIGNQGNVYFDDISFIASNKQFVAGAPADEDFYPTPVGIENNGKGEYFTDETKTGLRYDYSNKNQTTLDSTVKDGGNTGPFVTTHAPYADAYRTPTGEVFYTKTLKADNSNYHTVMRYNVTAAPAPSDSNNQVIQVVELDMAVSSSVRNFFVMTFASRGMRGDIYFHGNEDGTFEFGNVAAGTSTTFNCETWYNFRFEIYHDGAYGNCSTVKVFVNGEYACTVKGLDYLVSSGSTPNYVGFSLRHMSDPGDYLMLDNLYFGYEEVAKTAAE